ncbi:electron transfer flavoprotein subunit beta/FixA family protein [Actinomycetospora termitidis]|uniref:Electron transfer flavoprotein subunit beta n=1 Tax=Actinomycetospora termitidis TaxID=3053470 RepID=A0ABT7M8J4_9PSEU|nr:electron transfer flavoprotein subunit beta/FixA family protein [Actinomycetospora sp. Odt1-22]MDL5156998.1 electron transfer flavoprotein subunit beta/FixA family protein [Actinomycetospora sp. Odt1-22]
MNIVVLIKQVPDTWSERTLSDGDKTLDRASSDAVLDEINERAVEEALKIKEAGGDAEVTILTAGPDRATDAIRKALSMGADKAVHVNDEAIHGSDAVATAKVLAKAIGTVGDVDLVLAGNEATDGRSGAMAGVLGELLGWPSLTHANELSVSDGTATVKRETDEGTCDVTASLPAVVSVGEKINEPRYPSFKGIMAAKKKPVSKIGISDLGLDASEVGLAGSLVQVDSFAPRPPKSGGQKVEDEGDGGAKIAEFLVGQKLI